MSGAASGELVKVVSALLAPLGPEASVETEGLDWHAERTSIDRHIRTFCIAHSVCQLEAFRATAAARMFRAAMLFAQGTMEFSL